MENNSPFQSLFKGLLFPFILLCTGSVLSALVIPGIISDSSEIESLHEARLKKAIEFGDRNEDFVSKLNVLKTNGNFPRPKFSHDAVTQRVA